MALGVGPVRLFRNTVGRVFDERSQRWIQYGLCVGSSDLIGWKSVTITPEMVGQKVAVFVALECKSATGNATDEQCMFVDAVQRAGGIAAVVRSDAQAELALLRGL
jgi:hypothetical protein